MKPLEDGTLLLGPHYEAWTSADAGQSMVVPGSDGSSTCTPAPDITDLIHKLVYARSQLIPPIPKSLCEARGEEIYSSADWGFEAWHEEKRVSMRICVAGLGWVVTSIEGMLLRDLAACIVEMLGVEEIVDTEPVTLN